MNPDIANMMEALGDHSLEYRVCHLLLFFAASDSELSEQEIINVSLYLKGMLQALGSEADLKELILGCLEDMKNNGNVEVLKETIGIFAHYLPKAKLQEIANGIEEVIAGDNLSQAEAELLQCLRTDWKLI